MGRITVDINEEWLDAAQEILGTKTKVATINEALRTFALRKKAAEIVAALNSVEMDYSGSAQAWRYGGGRDLSRIEEDVRRRLAEDVRSDDVA
jgi:Arc/MetJ family transcription regulator